MRSIVNRRRAEIRPRRQPISHAQVERVRHRAWLEASLPRISV